MEMRALVCEETLSFITHKKQRRMAKTVDCTAREDEALRVVTV